MPNSCLCCKFVEVKTDGTNLTWYHCKLVPGLIVGRSTCLTDYQMMETCDKFVCYDKEEKEYDKKHKSHN